VVTRETVLAAIKAGLADATRSALWTADDRLDDALFPFWSDAVHRLLVDEGACGCSRGHRDRCFAAFLKERRLALVGHGLLTFRSFVALFREAHEEFLGTLATQDRMRSKT
jgi:hypothetical protein